MFFYIMGMVADEFSACLVGSGMCKRGSFLIVLSSRCIAQVQVQVQVQVRVQGVGLSQLEGVE